MTAPHNYRFSYVGRFVRLGEPVISAVSESPCTVSKIVPAEDDKSVLTVEFECSSHRPEFLVPTEQVQHLQPGDALVLHHDAGGDVLAIGCMTLQQKNSRLSDVAIARRRLKDGWSVFGLHDFVRLFGDRPEVIETLAIDLLKNRADVHYIEDCVRDIYVATGMQEIDAERKARDMQAAAEGTGALAVPARPAPDMGMLDCYEITAKDAMEAILSPAPAEALARHLLLADSGGDRGITGASHVFVAAGLKSDEARRRALAIIDEIWPEAGSDAGEEGSADADESPEP